VRFDRAARCAVPGAFVLELAASTRRRRDIHGILAAALHAADAGKAVERVLRRDGDVLLVDGEPLPRGPGGRLLLAGAGKAAAVMARAAVKVAGPLLAKGVVVAGVGADDEIAGVDVLVGSHPLPDERSLAAATAIFDLVGGAGPADVVLFLLSGGASAMIEQPVAGITLEDLQAVTHVLLESGASIAELNEVRKALSAVKAGGVARAAAPALVQTLAVSDVVGDSPAVIGSAPTVAAASDPERVATLLRRYEVPTALAASIGEALALNAEGHVVEANAGRMGYRVIANVDDALAGAARGAREAGYEPEIVSSTVVGEARDVGAEWGRKVRAWGSDCKPPRCFLAGGETTVRVVGQGRGGRNQELALAASIVLAGQSGITVAAVGTDGRDGPTSAAGAIADGYSVERGRRLGHEAAGFLADNDSYTFFEELGDLVMTGPTRTNVMDIHIALVGLPDD